MTPPPRQQRADAVRNRQKILAAASEQIALRGPEVSTDEIAAAAGVAVGTLYRHFPTKTDLVASVVAAYVERVADEAEAAGRRLDDGASALDELSDYLARVVDASATDQAVKAAAQSLGADGVQPGGFDRANAALARLIEAGQADGDIHPDATVADLHLLFGSIPSGRPAADRARWHTLVMAGLTTRPRPTSA